MPDPVFQCAYDFTKYLTQSGIDVTNKPENLFNMFSITSERKLLFTHTSPKLSQIVYYTNLKSDNMYAEALLKTIALKKKGNASISTGTEILKQYLESKSIPTDGLFLVDACGLSRADNITTSQLAQLLVNIAHEKYYNVFLSSLPVAGKTGTMSGFGKGTILENNLRAKSGYINRARNCCGYLQNKKGRQLAFSVMFNNYNCTAAEIKKKTEKLLVSLAEE
jgi:serine-type D-Ala-D-Ala carboxypeptidase/endopeptidase (penicillin-binding protein 4)